MDGFNINNDKADNIQQLDIQNAAIKNESPDVIVINENDTQKILRDHRTYETENKWGK